MRSPVAGAMFDPSKSSFKQKQVMKIAYWSGLVGLVLLAAGCAYYHPGYQPRTDADRALENNIRIELSRYGELGADAQNIQVAARDGSVTLAGPVRSEKNREMIDTLVRNTSGVVAVNDQMTIGYSPTGAVPGPQYPPAPVYTTIPPGVNPPPVVVPGPAAVPGQYPDQRVRPATADDTTLANRIVSQMRYDTVPAEWLQNVTITVTGGNVYVQGWVPSEDQHHAIIDSLQHCRGVVAIYDQTQVR